METILLADRPTAVSTVATWYFEKWGSLTDGETLAHTSKRLESFLNRDKIPLIILAVEGDQVVGAAQLKYREMEIFPDRVHWLGGVYVAAEHRGRAIGTLLIEKVVDLAMQQNVEDLYLQTEEIDGGLYSRLGWQPIELVQYKGNEVLVMKRHLGN